MNTFEHCTNRKIGVMDGMKYPIDCGKCPVCLKAIQLIMERIMEIALASGSEPSRPGKD